jgi:RNA polymerase primary sigma factor
MVKLNAKNQVNKTRDNTAYNDDFDALSMYFKEINRTPLLTREEEDRIAKEAKAGSKEAKEKLIMANLRFVVTIARKYQHRGLSLDDLISEGNIGLMTAAEKYDVDRGYHFISYATWWIRQSILKALDQTSNLIRLPLNRAQELLKIKQAEKEIEKSKGGAASTDEIAIYCGMDRKKTVALISVSSNMVSLDTALTSEEFADALTYLIEDNSHGNPETITINLSLQEGIERVLSTLSLKEQDVIKYRFGLGGIKIHTLKEVGDKYQLTKERIRQIENKALAKLRLMNRSRTLEHYLLQ